MNMANMCKKYIIMYTCIIYRILLIISIDIAEAYLYVYIYIIYVRTHLYRLSVLTSTVWNVPGTNKSNNIFDHFVVQFFIPRCADAMESHWRLDTCALAAYRSTVLMNRPFVPRLPMRVLVMNYISITYHC